MSQRQAQRKFSVQDLQREANHGYYSKLDASKVTSNQRLGFHTPSQGRRYAEIHAMEFIRYAREKEGPLRIDEFGAADGMFAKYFLDYLKKEARDVYDRTLYCAWDKYVSLRPVLEARFLQHQGNVSIGTADITDLGTNFQENQSDWVFCHELFDDLATRVLAQREGVIKELYFTEREFLGAKVRQYLWEPFNSDVWFGDEIKEFMRPFMAADKERLRITFPVDGIKAFYGVSALLKPGGKLKIFDYGYLRANLIDKLTQMSVNAGGRAEMFPAGYTWINASALHVEGTEHAFQGEEDSMQLTTPVNFPFLDVIARTLEMRTTTETLLSWASRITGELQTFPGHYAQGIAYLHDETEDMNVGGYPREIFILLSAHNEALRMGTLPPDKIYRYAIQLTESRMVERINAKRRRAELELEIVPDGSQTEFRRTFEPEIDELVRMGYDKTGLMWALFATPHDYSFSGSWAIVAFTASKQDSS